jgi:hypothetical protein
VIAEFPVVQPAEDMGQRLFQIHALIITDVSPAAGDKAIKTFPG